MQENTLQMLSKQHGQAFQRVLALLSDIHSAQVTNTLTSIALDQLVMYNWHPIRYQKGVSRIAQEKTPTIVYVEGYRSPDNTLWYVPTSDWHELLARRDLTQCRSVDVFVQGIINLYPANHFFSYEPPGLWVKGDYGDFLEYRQVVPLTDLSPAEILCLRAFNVPGEYAEETLKNG